MRYYRNKKIKEYINTFYPELRRGLKRCRVLDLGCGVGKFSCDIAPFVKEVVGIDNVPKNVQRAGHRGMKSYLDNVKFKVASIQDYKDSNKYDIVILSDVLEHVKNPHEILARALSFLKEDGIMYVNVPNRYWPVEAHTHIPLFGYLPKKFGIWLSRKFTFRFDNTYLMSFKEFKKLVAHFPISYRLKILETRRIYRVGKKLISISPFFWNFAPAFQVIVKKNDK